LKRTAPNSYFGGAGPRLAINYLDLRYRVSVHCAVRAQVPKHERAAH
jgi:hypothetical protein